VQKKLLISIISCFLVSFLVRSQTVEQTIAWGKQQMALGQYNNALKAFKRVSFFRKDEQKVDLPELMAVCLEKTGAFAEALKLYDYSIEINSVPAGIIDLKLKKANLLIEMEQYDLSLIVLLNLPAGATTDQYLVKEYLLGINYFKKGYFPESAMHFSHLFQNENKLLELDKLFEENYRILRRYNPQKAIFLNLILPGAGYLYAGKTGQAAKSVALTGGAVALFGVTAKYESFTDGIIAILPWFQKTYIGGISGVGEAVNNRIEEAQTSIYSKIINLTEPKVERFFVSSGITLH